MQVRIQWRRLNILTGRYENDGEPVDVEARETKRLLYVPFPSGWIKQFRKFTSLNDPRSRASESYDNGRMRYVVSWDPKQYS